MTELVITTQEQLELIVAKSVNSAIKAQLEAQTKPTPQASKDERLLSRKEAAKLLGVSLVTLNEWSKKGIVVGCRIASRVRYKKTELEQSLIQMQTSKNWKAA